MSTIKKTNIHHWPFPVYGKITEHTKKNILPKPTVTHAAQAILKLRRKNKTPLGVEDAIF